MKATLENLNIDKSNWMQVKFGDIAKEPKENAKDLQAEGIEHVVGLEHINQEDVHLRRSANLEESTTFTKKFAEGDVLFGRRRAYLKKAAQASFSGICSGDITVFRAKDDILPELLPFVVCNDKFFDYAVKHSAGGLSPRVKFKDLANYEFLLPPKDQQKQLAELLWAMDDVIEKEKKVLDELEICFKTYRKSFIEGGFKQEKGVSKRLRFGNSYSKWRTDQLANFCKLIGGNAFKSIDFRDKGSYQVLRIGNITDDGFNFSKAPVFVDDISKSEEKYLIPKGTIILSLTGTNNKRDYGFPSLMTEHNKYLLNQRLVMLVPDPNIMLPEFLFLLAKMELFQGRFFLNATGTANQANVSIQDVYQIELPTPSLQEQREIITKINKLRSGIASTEPIIASSKALQKSLINQIF